MPLGETRTPGRGGTALGELGAGVALAACGLGFAVAASRIPLHSPLWAPYTSPGVYPLLLGAILAVGGLWVAARAVRGGFGLPTAGELVRGFREWGGPELLKSLAAVTAYLALLGRLPFALVAGGFVVATAVTLGRDDPQTALRQSLWGAACVAVLSELVFQRLLGARVP